MKYNFDDVLSDKRMNRMKWEYEVNKSSDPGLLCFGTADMDFKSPEPVLSAIREITDIGHLGYPYLTKDYYNTIQDWLYRRTNWQVDVPQSIANNVGIYTSIWAVFDALTDIGDEIIIQTPVHFCFAKMIEDNRRKLVVNPLKKVNGKYEMDFEHLEGCFTDQTKLFWLCNPHNPVGRAWTKEELQKLADICLKHHVLILSDDVYCGLVFPGIQYTPIASLSKEVSNSTITCYSASKSYNTTGVRFSFIITENTDILKKYKQSLQKLDLTYGLNIFGIAATQAAFKECDTWLSAVMRYIAENHETTAKFISQSMPEIKLTASESTYFAWLNTKCFNIPSYDLTEMLKRDAHILVCSGAELGKGGEDHIRLNLACPKAVLVQGLSRFGMFYAQHMT